MVFPPRLREGKGATPPSTLTMWHTGPPPLRFARDLSRKRGGEEKIEARYERDHQCRLLDKNSQQCRPDRGSSGAARSRAGIRAISIGGSHGAEGFRRPWSICARPFRSIPRAGRNSTTCACRTTAGAFFLRQRKRDEKSRAGATMASRRGKVPGEYRAMLRRLMVIQGDTGPASVEQQRHLGKTAPSLYDMRNVFRSMSRRAGTCGRWSTCCTSISAATAVRRPSSSCSAARRCRQTAHAGRLQRGDTGLAVVPHVHLLHGSRRQDALESCAVGLRPLSRTCRFMLTEEAHHMFVGETGIGRTLQRTCRR